MFSLRKQRILYAILLFIWITIIFIMSSQRANESAQLSNTFVVKIVKLIYPGFSNFSAEKQLEIMQLTSFLVRKTAHFLEYFVLGVFSILLVDTHKKYKCKYRVLTAILFCIVYAVSDEVHQHFVPGRACRFVDVIIDTSGALIAILILTLIKNKTLGRKSGENDA